MPERKAQGEERRGWAIAEARERIAAAAIAYVESDDDSWYIDVKAAVAALRKLEAG